MRIFDFAIVAAWEDRLAKLAGLAEPESWEYRSVPATVRLPVLDSYVRYTFLRLSGQGQVAEVEQNACFNTGLLTPGQEELFGVFTQSKHFDQDRPTGPQNKKWFLTSWARAGDRVMTNFRSLPSIASYWTDPAELIFNPSLEIQPQVDHIVRQNLNRFPIELGGCVDEKGVPTDLTDIPDIEEDEPEDEAGGRHDQVQVPLATRNALDGAIKHSIRLARRSYRVAVPQFHQGRIQLLLPLYLRESHRPDLALTLELQGDWYRAATVLYPDWAYRHARLLSRPNSEWLGGFRTDLDPEKLPNKRLLLSRN